MSQELLPGHLVGAEGTRHGACHHSRIGSLDASHRGAKVQAFDNNSNAVRLHSRINEVGDLPGHALLNLQPAGKHVDDARNLGQADHALQWQVGYMCTAEEGKHVVLAQTIELNVTHDHHLVVLDVEERVID